MAEAALTRVGLPPNEQVIMCDRGFGNKTSMPANRGDSSRYAPGLGRGGNSLDIEAVTAPCGKQMGRFAMTANTSGDTFFNYPLHTDADDLSGEFEIEVVAATAGGTGNLEVFKLRTDDGGYFPALDRGSGRRRPCGLARGVQQRGQPIQDQDIRRGGA